MAARSPRRILALPGAPQFRRPEQRIAHLATVRLQLRDQQRGLAADPSSAAQVGAKLDDLADELREGTRQALDAGVSMGVETGRVACSTDLYS